MSNKMKKIKKNKKGQVGEVIEDFPAFVVIALMLIILVVFTVLMYKGEAKARQQKIDEKIIQDEIGIMLNSLMQEKQENGMTFADLVRNKDSSVMGRLDKEIQNIYEVYNQRGGIRVNVGGSANIYYANVFNECQKVDRFGKNTCFFIPGNDLILIKVITFYGSI